MLGDAMHPATAMGQMIDSDRHHFSPRERLSQHVGSRLIGLNAISRHDDRVIGDVEVGVRGTEHFGVGVHGIGGFIQLDQFELAPPGIGGQLQCTAVFPDHFGIHRLLIVGRVDQQHAGACERADAIDMAIRHVAGHLVRIAR